MWLTFSFWLLLASFWDEFCSRLLIHDVSGLLAAASVLFLFPSWLNN
jgi:hypothetical protein